VYRRMGYLAAAIALSALILVGCAQDKAGDRTTQSKAQQPPPQAAEHQRVRESTQSFLIAMQTRQDARACRMMTHRLQHAITFSFERHAEPGNCQTRATDIYSSAKAPGHLGARITTIDLKGASANATVTAPGGIESDIELQKVTGTWKIANF
jgi:hypothetical protein